MTCSPGWRLVEGDGEVFVHDGLLAVRLPAGKRQVKLAYGGDLFRIGLAITALTAGAALALGRREARVTHAGDRRNRRATGAGSWPSRATESL